MQTPLRQGWLQTLSACACTDTAPEHCGCTAKADPVNTRDISRPCTPRRCKLLLDVQSFCRYRSGSKLPLELMTISGRICRTASPLLLRGSRLKGPRVQGRKLAWGAGHDMGLVSCFVARGLVLKPGGLCRCW